MPRNRRRAQRSVDDTQLSLGVASLTVHEWVLLAYAPLHPVACGADNDSPLRPSTSDGLPFLSYPSSRPVVPTSPPNAPMKPAVRDTVSGLGIATGVNRYGSPVPIPRKGGGGSYTNGTLERTSSTQRSVPSLQTIPVSVSPSAAIPIVLNEFTLERNIDDVSPSSSSGYVDA
ncbi:hypothetical protein DL93DRAFT_126423 [Clavulina sp. PMI_390]|nr:hypothetical protein DL93DRAFT_126423 [Clavulina sp. PMI_390]